ncbi:hypothetical protein [Blastococcus sp. TF02A-26]|uniref:hypothetical protein n=1 Tax=Blastococcus sp. TF02A-26 TaxID=2250577 RepID=UPI000DEBCD2F|nr:hypothetical protein [Blastococcus sp. TF02A-26]RBY86821.1 hypothetical protein DQ240_08430 [Blastococcus sp. TF02A-26]
MTSQTAPTARRRRTRARVAASVAVLGVTGAVAGLATYGTFTDSTSPVVTTTGTGVLSIDLGTAAGAATIELFPNGGFLAGDSESSPVDLVNDGTTALSAVSLASRATTSSALDTDPVNGLQLTVRDCSVDWAKVDGAWSCSGAAATLYSGRILLDSALPGVDSLAPGGVDHLLLTASLPSTATAGGAASALDFTFTAVQRDGAAR